MTIEQKFKEVIELAERAYAIDLSDVILEGSITGYRMIGQAGTYKDGTRKFRYSPAHLANNPDYYINEIVPHEIAHIVCAAIKSGKNHDAQWRRVAKHLGCSLPRASVPQGTFTLEEPKKRRAAKTYTYIDSLGNSHEFSGQRHSQVQKRGRTYTVTDTGAKITAQGYQA